MPEPLDTPPPADRASGADITHAYRLILKREPDPSGLEAYRARRETGLTLQTVIAELLASDEYADGVRKRLSGSASAEPNPEPRTPEPGTPEPGTQPTLIDPADVIRRHSLDELNATAEEYYRRVDEPTPLMAKPFAFLHETPEMLENLGLLFKGLHLGKTMTVLDFGAGTGWLSRILAQLHCQAICCDVSATALAIGRRLFDTYPLIGNEWTSPAFSHFDGRRIDLADQSVDRIICFDAFHHIPNQAEILREFARVLRPGGIAGFSEPGRRHSESPQSQYEMRNHRVLENDIRLEDIDRSARAAGFTDLQVTIVNDLRVPLDTYGAMFSPEAPEAVRQLVWEATRATTFGRSIFFLHKGAERRDSRSHVGLAHRMDTDLTHVTVPAGRPLVASFRVTNTGEAHWLETNRAVFGIVRLATHLYDAAGRLIEVDHSRHDLPSPVAPGESVEMTVTIPLPPTGSYRLAVDLVAEGVSWFENLGSKPVTLTVERP